jgi:hypothetical protein
VWGNDFGGFRRRIFDERSCGKAEQTMNEARVSSFNDKVTVTIDKANGFGESKTLSIKEADTLKHELNTAINKALAYRPNPLKVCQDRAVDVAERFKDVANSFGVCNGPVDTADATIQAARALEAYAKALKDLHR